MVKRKGYRVETSRNPKVWMKCLEELSSEEEVEENGNEIEEDPLEIEDV